MPAIIPVVMTIPLNIDIGLCNTPEKPLKIKPVYETKRQLQ
jgi:hypothetical protein